LAIATVFLFGVIVYYLHYEWMHLGHHIPGYNHIFPWSNKLKTAHQLHHYRNENYWWGITNSIGDKVFGTYKKHNEVERSETIRHINI
jgi:sterol desaturase/sphingolipid hydroxylase (fatty acid hydroxylase superfamily)